MHQLGGEMIYCISILEGYSRAILASAVTVEPHEVVKKSGKLEKTRVHWHAVVYANKRRADGHVEPILPE
jgi:hypothetical protein